MPGPVTLSQIAKAAKVSPSAVSNVLLGTGAGRIRVSEQTARKIRDIAAKLHYVPNQAAQQLAGKKSNLIGVLINPQPIEINYRRLSAIEMRARELGYRAVVGFEQVDAQVITAYADDFAARNVAGVICMHHTFPGDATTIPNALLKRIEHVMFIDQPAQPGAAFVGTDYSAGVAMLVAHLRQRGRKRIALALNELTWYSGPRLKAGYLAALGIKPTTRNHDLLWIRSERLSPSELPGGTHELTEQATIERIIQDLAINARADAIIAWDDSRAAEIMHALHDAGLRTPEDVAVAGFGNFALSNLIRPRMTTLDHELDQVGRRSVELLIDMINGERSAKQAQEFIMPRVIEREST